MEPTVYEQLAAALDRLPNAFPRTPSRVELKILQKIFSPEEAGLACHLTGTPEPAGEIASRLGLPEKEVRIGLLGMARRGLVWYSGDEGGRRFRLAPFVVGLYESQIEIMDHELAHLVEEYFATGGAEGIMQPLPALHRVVPAQRAIQTEQILPYDDVRSLLLSAKSFANQDCICRVQQRQLGHECEFPANLCLNFSTEERLARPGDISQAEALALLDRCEEIGLVHSVSNVIHGVWYICNCCVCCCGLLKSLAEKGLEGSVARAAYYAAIDLALCGQCGACLERCPMSAISETDDGSVVDQARCIGCGLCVTGCPNDAARLERRPDAEIVPPPTDFHAWEQARLQYRKISL